MLQKYLVVLCALLLGVAVQAAAPQSVVGTWKIKHTDIDGKSYTRQHCGFAAGALMNLKKDGSATWGGIVDWKWSYDKDTGELVMRHPTGWFSEKKHVLTVKSLAKKVKEQKEVKPPSKDAKKDKDVKTDKEADVPCKDIKMQFVLSDRTIVITLTPDD